MKSYLTCLLAIISILFLGCSTDDVEGVPTGGGTNEKIEIPDAAFGEYMVYRQIPGVIEEVENNQVKYFLFTDEVAVVSELPLSKTGSRIDELINAGVVTAEQKITDLTGLEHFVGLQILNLTSNDITSIDLTNLAGLQDLGLNFTRIGNLDVTQNPELTSIRCASSSQAEENQKMTTIDLSNNTQLRELRLSNHNFVEIDLSNNLLIDEELNMEGNPGPDGDPETGDIVVPAVIYDQLAPENRLGVISDADVVTTVFLDASETTIGEDDSDTTITVSLNLATDQDVTVDLELSGNAILDTDYSIASQQLTIPSGSTEITTTLTSIQDVSVEGNETVTISLGNIDNAEAGENQDIDITIEDDDFNIPLILNEILYDPPDGIEGDANGDGTRDPQEDEFIELYNNSDSPLDVSGFMIFDAEALDAGTPRFTVPDGTTIAPNSALVIFGGGNPTGNFGGSTVFASDDVLNLNNAGDMLTVQDNNGAVILTFDIEPLSNNPDESYTRNPDITGEFAQHADDVNGTLFTPGTKIDGSPF